ncbi:MAG TPA: ATP-binding protein [Candidatus Hydrogenedentes bacterium]|nr:ATP-binding protein [Candidatus Hydrogenedentota bacterium]HNT89203.1 ATP-binding protein [Candidatus Hydrogenedentota bacterium]
METVNVLVVDDELGIRAAVSRVLRGFTVAVPDFELEVGFDVSEAESGEQALDIIQATPPQILLLDNKLPGISGMEVLEQVAPLGLDMHIVIITAYASIETAVRATKQGAFDFLPKPFTPTDLKSTVRKTTKHLVVTRHAKALAAEKRRLRFQFISVLAHELKAPLNAVEGYLNILRDPGLVKDERVHHEFIERCLVRTGFMRKMIVDLLDLTRIESGERPREIQDCDLVHAARAALDTAAPDARERGIVLALHADGPIPLRADPAELAIMLNNLVSNAVKYNRDQGRVDVTLRRRNGEAVIAVSDTGIGLTKDEAAKLFNDFVRIKNEKTANILGSGLGLSTVKKLALLYGGDIKVASDPDKGSTFTLTVRDADAASAQTAADR